jgi:hypothetical protein
LANEQRSIVAKQIYRASLAKIDCLIDALKLLEIDDRCTMPSKVPSRFSRRRAITMAGRRSI